jgi:hypothetical protein
MVAAAVTTEQVGGYGTVAGLQWAVLTSAYFALWTLREAEGRTRRMAWVMCSVWSLACLAVAASDAFRFQDLQAWIAFAMTAAVLLAVLALRRLPVRTPFGAKPAPSA